MTLMEQKVNYILEESPGLNILDSGTADGYWLRDLQSSTPAPHQYTGTDITQQWFPSRLPPGITLKVQSIAQPWPKDWHRSFDVVHQRLTLPGAGSFPLKDAVMNLVELVKPGGWIQLVEALQIIGPDDGPAMRDFLQLITDVFESTGAGIAYAEKLPGWLKEAGLELVQVRRVDLYLGATNPNAELAKKGARSTALATASLVSQAKGLPTSFSDERLDTLVQRFEEELSAKGEYYPLLAVWGRKPIGSKVA